MLEKQTIKIKLLSAFLLILVPAAVIFGITSYIADTNSKSAESINKSNLPKALSFMNLDKDVIMIQQWLTNVALTRGEKGYDKGYTEAETRFHDAENKIDSLIEKFSDSPEIQYDLKTLKANLKNYYDVGIEVANTYIEAGPAAGNAMLDVFVSVRDNFNILLKKYMDDQTNSLIHTVNDIQNDLNYTKYAVILFSIAFIIFGIIVALTMARTIILPIKYLNQNLYNISEVDGDLTALIDVKSNDEIGEMSQSFNKFTIKLRDVISDVISISNALAQSANEIAETTTSFSLNAQQQAAATEELSATTEEMTLNMETITNGTKDQMHRIDSLASNINELSKIIEEMSRRINSAMELIENIASQAESGGSYLTSMNQSMKKIEESSSKIIDIVQMINEISDKINLLALNAAIEAARAGEAGKGFAVVADEVGKLADRTSGSINDITSLITTNGNEINKGLASVTDTVNALSQIINGVNKINEMMNTISQDMIHQLSTNQLVNEEADLVKIKAAEIKSATEEQKIAVNEIANTISSITQSTQKASGEAETIAINTSKTSDTAGNLRKLVGFFKI